MGAHQIDTVLNESGQAAEPRSFLFLQGPISDFFDRLGRTLVSRGHRVHRINLHGGDRLFWHLPATNFRGRFDDWRGFIGKMLETHAVTDLILHGDRRPYHVVAAEEARARGIQVIATDLGYVRPDWITLERDGMSTYSRFPRAPAAIRALAGQFPIPDLAPRYHTPFWLISVLDILYNIGLVFGRPFYPHYRYHGLSHPFAEYFGWICSHAKRFLSQSAATRAKARLRAAPGSYFVFPLQLATDFQIRAHSPFADARDALRQIIASFARSGSPRSLVIVGHPLDNGLIDWCGLARGLSRQSLDEFWHQPAPPDRQLNQDFLKALIGTTQVKGGYYTRAAQDKAIAGFIERLEGGLYLLPRLDATE